MEDRANHIIAQSMFQFDGYCSPESLSFCRFRSLHVVMRFLGRISANASSA